MLERYLYQQVYTSPPFLLIDVWWWACVICGSYYEQQLCKFDVVCYLFIPNNSRLDIFNELLIDDTVFSFEDLI